MGVTTGASAGDQLTLSAREPTSQRIRFLTFPIISHSAKLAPAAPAFSKGEDAGRRRRPGCLLNHAHAGPRYLARALIACDFTKKRLGRAFIQRQSLNPEILPDQAMVEDFHRSAPKVVLDLAPGTRGGWIVI